VIHTVKGSSVVNEAKFDVFLELSCFFYDPVDVGNLISGSSAFSKSNLYIWKFLGSCTFSTVLKPSLKDFEYYLDNMWNEHSCAVVWTFFSIRLLWDWKETLTASSFRIWNISVGSPSSPLALFVVMLPKARLTSHTREPGSRLVTIPSWLSGSLRSFLYSSSLNSWHLFLISSASVRSLLFLSFIEPIFAWNVPLVSLIFLKRSLVFPIPLFPSTFLHCSLKKAFLSFLAILWNSVLSWLYLSLSSLPFVSLLFSAICNFSWGWFWS